MNSFWRFAIGGFVAAHGLWWQAGGGQVVHGWIRAAGRTNLGPEIAKVLPQCRWRLASNGLRLFYACVGVNR